jgi:hypothetical protein
MTEVQPHKTSGIIELGRCVCRRKNCLYYKKMGVRYFVLRKCGNVDVQDGIKKQRLTVSTARTTGNTARVNVERKNGTLGEQITKKLNKLLKK